VEGPTRAQTRVLTTTVERPKMTSGDHPNQGRFIPFHTYGVFLDGSGQAEWHQPTKGTFSQAPADSPVTKSHELFWERSRDERNCAHCRCGTIGTSPPLDLIQSLNRNLYHDRRLIALEVKPNCRRSTMQPSHCIASLLHVS